MGEEESVVTYRLMKIEEAQQRTADSLDKFREDLNQLATKAEVSSLEGRLRTVEDRINRGWIAPTTAIGGGLMGVAAAAWQMITAR